MINILNNYGSFTDEERLAFEKIAQVRLFKAKTLVFDGNHVFDRLYYIQSGIIRSYRIVDGEDYTYYFFTGNEFAVDYQSYLTNMASPLFFEALTDTEVYLFPKSAIYQLYEKYPKFEKIGRLMAEQAYLSAADRLKQHQTDDLKTRYQKLIAKSPNLFQSVPQHYIASYLGVKPQSLSRVRAEISGKKY